MTTRIYLVRHGATQLTAENRFSGAVGVEFASMFSRFGSKTTVIEVLPRIVPVEDEEISRELPIRVLARQSVIGLRGETTPPRIAAMLVRILNEEPGGQNPFNA